MEEEIKRGSRAFVTAGTVLGLGMGGFLDGILFHQILQLHNMLSNRIFPDTLVKAEINMFWDGLSHAFTWLATLLGIFLLWRAGRGRRADHSGKILAGGMLFGWGLFNFVEGLINHQILRMHHVVERAVPMKQLFWDMVFLASGIALMVAGRLLIRRAQSSRVPHPPENTPERTLLR